MKVLYWDASAILSAMVGDRFTGEAREALRGGTSVHLVSSLALAEFNAVLARLERERAIGQQAGRRARKALAGGPWRMAWIHPDRAELETLSARYALKGADLWHLAAAAALAREMPGLKLLAFDDRLKAAASAEGMGD